MADGPNQAQRGGATPSKLILIGVLAVVLAAVLYIQFGRARSADVPAARKPSAAQRAQAGRASAAATAMRQQEEPTKTSNDAPRRPDNDAAWKRPDLAAVIAYDPFAVPASFPQPGLANGEADSIRDVETAANQGIDAMARDRDQTRKQLEEMRQLGVKVILRHHDQYVALIGDQMIHVGDEINGFTVTAISPSGVRVERKIKE